MTFGEKIKHLRDMRRLSASECAKRAGITAQVWSDIEHDRSRRDPPETPRYRQRTLDAIALGLDVPVSAVMKLYYPEMPDRWRLDIVTENQGVVNIPSGSTTKSNGDNEAEELLCLESDKSGYSLMTDETSRELSNLAPAIIDEMNRLRREPNTTPLTEQTARELVSITRELVELLKRRNEESKTPL